jgi:chromosome segregation ATPase
MSKYAKNINEIKSLIADGKGRLPALKSERAGVSGRLQGVVNRLTAALAAAEKYEHKLGEDVASLAEDLRWLSDADEDIDKLTALLAVAEKSKDEASLKSKVQKGAEGYLGNNAGINWKKPLEPQREAIIKELTSQLANAEHRAKEDSKAYPDVQAKMQKHCDKHSASVKAMDDLLKKLDALDL